MLQKLYSRLHCLVGLLVLVSLAGCGTSIMEQYESFVLKQGESYHQPGAACGIAMGGGSILDHSGVWRHLHSTSDLGLKDSTRMGCNASNALEAWLVEECNKRHHRPDCIIVVRQEGGDIARDRAAVNLRKFQAGQQRQQQQAAQQQQQQEMQGRSQTCKGFGFKENTEGHTQCMFDLFKLEQSTAQSQALQSQAASNAAAQRALLQQQIDQQNFNQGIQLLQQSQQLLNPPRPTTNCQWYYATQTMRCR